MKKTLSLLTVLLFVPLTNVFAESAGGGFSLGSTRVIFNAKDTQATFTVNNTAKNSPFLTQSWITPYAGTEKPPFVITPPLYRQDQGSNTLRIRKMSDSLSKERESAFWINVKAIPSQSKKTFDENSISFAYVLRIKMFYRPSDLNDAVTDAYKKLTFSQIGSSIKVANPTPYFITFNKLSVNGVDLKEINHMVPPKGEWEYEIPNKIIAEKIEYKTITDFGGVTPLQVKNVIK